MACKYRDRGKDTDNNAPLRFVTASLHVDYLAPTPIDATLELRGKVKEIKGRKVIVGITLSAKGKVCVKGEVVVVQIPENFFSK
jgi:acyl-CoA thioesterase FadM